MSNCTRYGKKCHEFACSSSVNGICTEGMSLMEKRCVILEIENKVDFENRINEYLTKGYKIEASSCNSKYYKAILILGE